MRKLLINLVMLILAFTIQICVTIWLLYTVFHQSGVCQWNLQQVLL